MTGKNGPGADILGIEVTPAVVRAVRLQRGGRQVSEAAECPVLTIGDLTTLDPSAIGPALDEVMYQLGVDDRTEHLAAVTIGPRRAGVGSGPTLPTWLDRRARQLGENIVCAGKLGIAFCPQRVLDTAIMICEQANITVSRIDFAPMAAARTLKPGIDMITLGSGRGWRARLRDGEVLEVLDSADVPTDAPLLIVNSAGEAEPVDSLHGVLVTADAKSALAASPGQFAAAIGSALGVLDGSSGNLLDGDIVRGQQVPAAFTSEVGGIDTGEIAGSRTTVSLTRAQIDPQGHSAGLRSDDELATLGSDDRVADTAAAGGVLESAASVEAESTVLLGDENGWSGGDPTTYDQHLDSEVHTTGRPPADEQFEYGGQPGYGHVDTGQHTAVGFGYESETLDRDHQMVHPDDPINSFSPEPGAESTIDRRFGGQGLALLIAALALFILAIALGIMATQG